MSCSNQIRWATFDDVANAAALGTRFVQNPVNVTLADFEQPLAKSYNINVAFQKDVGFNLLPALTAAENAAVPLLIAGWSRRRAVARASEFLVKIGMGKRLEVDDK